MRGSVKLTSTYKFCWPWESKLFETLVVDFLFNGPFFTVMCSRANWSREIFQNFGFVLENNDYKKLQLQDGKGK